MTTRRNVKRSTASGQFISHKEAAREIKKAGQVHTASKAEATSFLKEIGILTKNGRVAARYR